MIGKRSGTLASQPFIWQEVVFRTIFNLFTGNVFNIHNLFQIHELKQCSIRLFFYILFCGVCVSGWGGGFV